MTNIVIAKWLEKIVKDSGADCILIPNGIDFEVFNIDIPIASRKGHTISMLYHDQVHKGSKYGIEALKRLKERYPDLEATLFGVPQPSYRLAAVDSLYPECNAAAATPGIQPIENLPLPVPQRRLWPDRSRSHGLRSCLRCQRLWRSP